YGAMDGASKFVRGDAIAGILILFINIIGGLVIGTVQHDLSFADAGRVYTLLTIGDGLVAQIPSLLLSTAVAIIVTRMSRSVELTEQVMQQLFNHPRSLIVAGSALGILGLMPGMPNLIFMALAIVCLSGGYWLQRFRAGAATDESDEPEPEAKPATDRDLSWEDVAPVDAIGLEVGYRLVPLVDRNQSGPLLSRIKGVRRKLSEELGFLIPAVHIRDNLELSPTTYRITLMGVPAGEGEIQVDRELAINPGGITTALSGVKTTDPAFGLEAYWIEPGAKQHAQTLGYTVVDASTVVATHLSELLKKNASQLLGHEEVQHLLDRLAEKAPKLVENLTPGTLSLAVVARVFQDLLAEGISVRNVRTIAESLAEHGARTQDPGALLGHVREALGASIIQQIYGLRKELPVISLDPKLEKILRDSLDSTGDETPSFEPALADRLHNALARAAQQQELRGEPAVLLVAGKLRAWLARLVQYSVPNLKVLAYGEIPQDRTIRVASSVGGE
ncbi:MAG: flagellar biosynthesis protein FlhA, partial [Gammaproteobacteria bacterium]|nr:flagellar biosynthesis protein FlhA [Gammaproteobacteria bacterium]